MKYLEPTIIYDTYVVDAIVTAEDGIHARPSSTIAKNCIPYKNQVYLTKKNSKERIDCKGTLNIMIAGITCKEEIRFYVEFKGDNQKQEAKTLCLKLKEIVSSDLEKILNM